MTKPKSSSLKKESSDANDTCGAGDSRNRASLYTVIAAAAVAVVVGSYLADHHGQGVMLEAAVAAVEVDEAQRAALENIFGDTTTTIEVENSEVAAESSSDTNGDGDVNRSVDVNQNGMNAIRLFVSKNIKYL